MIYIVSGLPRSGTSLMMQILDAGGLPVVTDHVRKPDIDNPKGYYEFEPVKGESMAWVASCEGRCVKMVSELLKRLPDSHAYTVFFMIRELGEVVASQNKMLKNMGKPTRNPERMKDLYGKHLNHIQHWLSNQPNMDAHFINYNVLMGNTGPTALKIATMLALNVDAMMRVVDPGLYRNRYGLS
jgi:hypothetical protein